MLKKQKSIFEIENHRDKQEYRNIIIKPKFECKLH